MSTSDAKLRTKVEIETIHALLEDVDYYHILRIDKSVDQEEVGNAFRVESRRLHPDRFSTLGDQALSDMANEVFRLVSEAYRTLKEPDQRAMYDSLLEMGHIRMLDDPQAMAQVQDRSSDVEAAATHPKAEKYWKMALRDWKDQSYKACVMNIQFAVTFEPDNEVFKEWLVKAKAAQKEDDSTKEHNPYKLRIV